jgi:hypothetical protein
MAKNETPDPEKGDFMKLTLIILAFSTFGLCQVPGRTHKGVNLRFLAVAGAAESVNLVDMVQTERCLKHVAGCVELDPLYGRHPSTARIFSESFAIDGAFILASWAIERHAPRRVRAFWSAPMVFQTASHAKGIYQSRWAFNR